MTIPDAASAHSVSAPHAVHQSVHRATAHRIVVPAVNAAANPLANLVWGHETGYVNDGSYPAYQQARGLNRRLLAKIALRPRAHWFGPWNPNDVIYQKMRDYIDDVTRGRSNVLVQMAIFRITPWEAGLCHRAPNASEQASYKQWIDRAAQAIGETHVAMILQPDLPFAFCTPHSWNVPVGMVAYAAKKFSALPNTSVYIDAGASDWYDVRRVVNLLRVSGVRYTRGFALNATHEDSTPRAVLYGAQIANMLYKQGIHGKRFVVNTAQNGKPFTYQWWHPRNPRGDYNNPAACSTRTQAHCVTLGIPPTWHVAGTWTKLPALTRSIAARLCDGYLWFGRPWLLGTRAHPSKVFSLSRSLAIARTSPF